MTAKTFLAAIVVIGAAIASEDAPMIGAGMASIADAKIALEQAHEAVQTAQD